MNKLTNPLMVEQVNEESLQTEHTVPVVKETFVEPTVSVPTDVLEATTFFQGPTIESSTI